MAVIFKADSDFSKVIKDYETLQRQNVALKEKMANVTKEVKEQGGGIKATFEGGLSQLKGMVSSYLSFQGAINLVNSALAEQKRLASEVHKVQLTAADAQAEVVKNLGGVPTEQATKFLKEIEVIAQKGGAPSVAPIYVAAAQTLSAVGDETLTKNILSETLPFFKSKPEELATFAGAVGDLATISGAKSQEEIRRIVGMILSSQRHSRGATLESFKNVAPAVAAVAAVDTSGDKIRAERHGLALSSALSTGIKDPDMALTKTATAEVATALAELLPEKDVIDAEGKVKRSGTGMKDLLTRLTAVQASPELQRRFFETGEGMQAATFRGPIKPIVQSLMSDTNSPVAAAFRNAMAGITDDPSIVRQMRTNMVSATPQLAMAETTRASLGATEKFQLGSAMGLQAQAREALTGALSNTRRGASGFMLVDDILGRVSFETARTIASPENAAILALRQKERHLRAPVDSFGSFYALNMFGAMGSLAATFQRSDAMLSAGEKEMVALLRDQIRILGESKAAQEKANSAPNVGSTNAAAQSLRNHTEVR